MFLIFDTETTGLPKNWKAPLTDSENWPRMVQLAWQVHDVKGELLEVKNYIVKPEGYTIPFAAEKIHGISTEKAMRDGKNLQWVLEEFNRTLEKAAFLVGHNVEFDISIVGAEYYRKQVASKFLEMKRIDTKLDSTQYCALPGGRGGQFKWPNLSELHNKLFGTGFEEAHNAAADVVATARCFLELARLGVIEPVKHGLEPSFTADFQIANPDIVQPIELEIGSNKDEVPEPLPEPLPEPEDEALEPSEDPEESEVMEESDAEVPEAEPPEAELVEACPFTHLHVHTQYSILDGAADISGLLDKAKADGMTAMAITDHGNMFGVKEFHNLARKKGIKPILGCEVYVAPRSRLIKEDKSDGGGRHLILLAKNLTGYHNLIKLVSYGWTEGFYYKPRIDKELLKLYHEGLIACSACLNGVISNILRHGNPEEAKTELLEYKEMFGEDFYLELQRHQSGDPQIDREVYHDQQFVNEHLIRLGKETNTLVVATNDVHFINQEDAEAHDRLLCISTGKDLDDPNRMRYTRQEWMKTREEMQQLFADVPEALDNTWKIVEKVEEFKLDSPPIMPEFPIPGDFGTMESYREKYTKDLLLEEFGETAYQRLGNFEKVLRVKLEADYLAHLVHAGAMMRYGDPLPQEVAERNEFELNTIKTMGFPGYFLIVWDFIKAAREMDVSVGPGRGSAAGSTVAYCLRITDIDPIKYDLLFERFLNPDRISMPDIDIDFDEDGRDKVLKWVVKKYGEKRVAHIITFGTMAPKMAIRDVARVQKLELSEADRLAKLIPERPGTTFRKAYDEVPELKLEKDSPNPLISQTLKFAEVLEGSVRQTGVHACGIIIGRDDLEEHIPLSTNKDAELYVSQFDGKHIESVGMLKMDFLGLKTLSIIKDAVANVKLSKGIDIDIDAIPLDDPKTFELYARGETTALFQFESTGMKKHLRALKPNRFEDLIAMNALYRPGPMEYIPDFIKRKHGQQKIVYDLPEMEEYLKDTYGITVYQEQVMLLSQKLAGFTKGMADSLRKAMGKKIRSMMDDLKEKFIEGCRKNGYEEKTIEKIWTDWEAFAQYAFNKSHSTCYAYVSYQTAYLKAHYPAEFMAAVLSRNLNDIKKITFFMEECKRMGLHVLVPDINESFSRFTVNKDGNIRFGMAAIKGVGESAVAHIIEEREKRGSFKDMYDFVERVNLSTVNKRSVEALVMGGGFDSFTTMGRHQYFITDRENLTFIDQLLRYGNLVKTQQTHTLFDDDSSYQNAQQKPPVQEGEEWAPLYKLNKEKELIGVYLSSHPLDDYRLEIDNFTNCTLAELENINDLKNRELSVAGLVTEVRHMTGKTGKPYGILVLEDYTDSYRFMLFGRDYEDYRKYLYEGYSLLVKGSIQQNAWRKDQELWEFKIKSMLILNNARDEIVNSLAIRVSLSQLNEGLIGNIKEQLESTPGKARIKFYIYDEAEGISIEMFSRNTSITVSNELIHYLDKHPEIDYKVS
ncbi:MAG: DNA polymerase III subunit alpha [Bacteroidales bacterium]|nr:DNA polymerase III subunit alpha [Bacteroidales bacterium]